MLVPVSQALEAAQQALRRAGVPSDHAHLQSDLLLEADLCGRASHGLMRLPRIIERILNGVADPNAVGVHRWRGQFLAVDGANGLGPVVAWKALEALMARARSHGVAVAAISANNHIGMLAWYARKVAAKGLVLIAASTSEALVHPWGGRRAMIGTNPLSMGVPTAGEPFVVDLATSRVSMGQIHDHALRGVAIPAGWALDKEGRPTTDGAAAREGSIAPFGEAKGYALGLALEVLVTCLARSAIGTNVVGTLDSTNVCNKGDLFIVIDPGEGAEAIHGISAYLDAVRASGVDGTAVTVPGDRASRARERNLDAGISLADETWHRIMQLACGEGAAHLELST